MQYKLDEIYNPDLSETHLYFYAGGTYHAGGVNVEDAADYLIEHGVPDEGVYPDPHRAFDYPFESLDGWENRAVKISNWSWIEKDVEVMKEALIEYGPLVFLMSIYQDFYSYKSGVYRHEWGPRVGGHVMTIVGYDDNQECWICKNSWGRRWGDNGWFKLAYDADLFATWYGNHSGVMYIKGIYGNLKPDVPKVQIVNPVFKHSYIFGKEFRILFKKLPVQKAVARIYGSIKVKVETNNTDRVEFYIDGEKRFDDTVEPYIWTLDSKIGLHTLKVVAFNNQNKSIDLLDYFKFF